MSWYDIETAAAEGHLTGAEVQELAMLLVFERVARSRRDDASRERFCRLRWSITVPWPIDELDLLQAVADAVDRNDEKVRSYTWWKEAEARGEDAAARHPDWLGSATCDGIAASLVGAEQEWMVRNPRRVVRALTTLLADGLVCRGEKNGTPYGYELTEAGESMLELDEVAA